MIIDTSGPISLVGLLVLLLIILAIVYLIRRI
jgi:hypothetical protein